MTKQRSIQTIVKGQKVSDGAGVRLTRIMGLHELPDLDPFLLLDAFQSDNPDDYIGGFPPHPHRGFETVTYLLDGRMRHKDSAGNEGIIEPGGVQWMTAGKGIIHSEMPEQKDGLLHGLQLWVNLPSEHKMVAPAYQEYEADHIPLVKRDGLNIRVIAGSTDEGVKGPVQNDYVDPLYLDIEMQANSRFTESLIENHNAFIYVLDGHIQILVDQKTESISANHLAVLSQGDCLQIKSDSFSRFILVSGKPLNESIARGGPFVMNTKAEIQQAFNDYESGNFT